jgi:hypothetical protein
MMTVVMMPAQIHDHGTVAKRRIAVKGVPNPAEIEDLGIALLFLFVLFQP